MTFTNWIEIVRNIAMPFSPASIGRSDKTRQLCLSALRAIAMIAAASVSFLLGVRTTTLILPLNRLLNGDGEVTICGMPLLPRNLVDSDEQLFMPSVPLSAGDKIRVAIAGVLALAQRNLIQLLQGLPQAKVSRSVFFEKRKGRRGD